MKSFATLALLSATATAQNATTALTSGAAPAQLTYFFGSE
jgi:hypothetical protein